MMATEIKQRILEAIERVENELRLDREAGAAPWNAEKAIWEIRQVLEKLE